MTDVQEVRKRMWEKMEDSPFLMIRLRGSDTHSEPMTAQLDKGAGGKFWFYTSRRNRIAAGGPAMAQFVSKDHRIFACIAGTLEEERDPAVIDRYWSKQTEAWFKGGRNDPDLLMLRFELDDAEIWEADATMAGFFKMLTGSKIEGGEVGRHVETALS